MTPTPTPTPGNGGRGTVVGPWGAALVATGEFLPGSLASDGTYLYALTGQAIVRSDPATGKQLSVAYSGQADPVITAGNYLWLVSSGSTPNQITLRRYTVPALISAGHVNVTLGTLGGSGAAMIASVDGTELFVGGGTTVAIVDPMRMLVTKRLTVENPSVTGLAISPDGTTLYAGTVPNAGAQGVIDVFSVATGAIARTQPGTLGLGTLLATRGGLWQVGGTGHANPVAFAPFNNPDKLHVEPSGGGGIYPSVTTTGRTVWIGGLSLNCLDPSTGRVRATASLADRSGELTASISGIVSTSDGKLYAVYFPINGSPTGGLVLLHPPKACDE